MRHGHRHPNALLALSGKLWAVAIPLVAGMALGAVVLVALRAARLRFTWALWGAPLAYLAWLADWQVGLAFGAATLTAAAGGAYQHFQAIEHGGEEARELRATTGPLRWVFSRLRGRSVGKNRVRNGKLAIGASPRGGVCRVPLGISRGVHALILGATGAGKTVSQAAIAQAYVLAGLPVIVIDPKGDPYLRAVLADAARRRGRRFTEWSPSGPSVYNPFERGGPTEIADKCLAGHRWTEPHYELATQRLLGMVLAAMRSAGIWPPSLSQIVAHMDPERLDALASKVGGETAERVCAYVDSLSERAKADLGGGRDRLAVLADGELGRWLDPEPEDGPPLSLERSLREGDVVYMNLDADRYPAASKLLAAALVIDLVTLTADLQGRPLGGLVVIDEFAALAAEQVSRLFARARSAGLSIVLGAQSLADLRGANPDDPSDTLTEQVLSNVEFTIAHRIGDPDSAERLARLGGTTPAWSTTQRVGGGGWIGAPSEGTRTREREFVILPDEFKRLPIGEAVLIAPTAKRPAQIVRIWPPIS